uniref:C-8 sterol isomerase n=1 Tax=Kalanchoe fedtschenkoi TaxID=63787 RepID=A0A7N0T787_KALFE
MYVSANLEKRPYNTIVADLRQKQAEAMSMKTVISTPSTWSSSASTRSTTTAMEPDRSESSSCYFPGCRKDANCSCDICLASINATLDLMPLTINKTSHNPRRPVAYPILTPLSFDSPSIISTPKMSIRRLRRESPTPCLKSTARVGPGPNDGSGTNALTTMTNKEDVGNNQRNKFVKMVLGFLFLLFGVELGLPWVVSRTLRPHLSPAAVRDLGERTFAVNDVIGKFRMLQTELQLSVDASSISNCSHNTPDWEINQDGLLLRSRCVLYKSATEEVSVWGWPLQTAGLLASSSSLRSFTVLSGRVTQWPESYAGGYRTINARGSWVQDKFRASVIQLDGQTWVLEYSRCMLLETEGLFSAAWDFLKYRLSSAYVRDKSSQLSWLAVRFKGYSGVDDGYFHPT